MVIIKTITIKSSSEISPYWFVGKDTAGEVIELHCRYDPDTLGGKKPADGRKVKGIVHWLHADDAVDTVDAVDATIRLYDRLFQVEHPAANDDFTQGLNPHSLTTQTNAKVEPSAAIARPGETFQFTRLGYFCADIKNHTSEYPVFNRTVELKNNWK